LSGAAGGSALASPKPLALPLAGTAWSAAVFTLGSLAMCAPTALEPAATTKMISC